MHFDDFGGYDFGQEYGRGGEYGRISRAGSMAPSEVPARVSGSAFDLGLEQETTHVGRDRKRSISLEPIMPWNRPLEESAFLRGERNRRPVTRARLFSRHDDSAEQSSIALYDADLPGEPSSSVRSRSVRASLEPIAPIEGYAPFAEAEWPRPNLAE